MARSSTARKKKTSKRRAKTGKKKTTRKKKTGTARKRTASRKKSAKTKRPVKKKPTRRTARPARKKATKKKVHKKKAAPAKKTKTTPKAVKTEPAPAASPASASREDESKPEVHELPSIEEAMASLRYREGSFVVHPKYGLGKVDRIIDRTLSVGTIPCLEISFPHQEMKLTIPVDQVERSGLRQPIGRREIDGVFKVLRGRATFDAKRRSAKRVLDYRKRLSIGDPTSLAEAVRDLARLSLKKSLSYEERKILNTALRILSREVALARGREADDVREEIEKIVYR